MIGTFSSSNQLSDNLRKVQLNNDVQRPLKFIQDVVTRWWSTYAMVERFLELLPYLEMLQMRGALLREEMLTSLEVNELQILKRILKPFMTVQKAMEGQKYVTNSLVPYVISTIREELKETLANAEDERIEAFVEKLLNDRTKGFNNYWGRGDCGTVFTENDSYGYMSRQKTFDDRKFPLDAIRSCPRYQ